QRRLGLRSVYVDTAGAIGLHRPIVRDLATPQAEQLFRDVYGCFGGGARSGRGVALAEAAQAEVEADRGRLPEGGPLEVEPDPAERERPGDGANPADPPREPRREQSEEPRREVPPDQLGDGPE